jgi:acyl-phosphate glycerol 3-phosphate acyltransferase
MNVIVTAIVFMLAYLLGSLPAAVWLGMLFHNTDVRKHGSGNAGTTNVIRVLGWKTGIPVLIIDLAKGWTAAMLPVFFRLADLRALLIINLQYLQGNGYCRAYFSSFAGLGRGYCSIWCTAGI